MGTQCYAMVRGSAIRVTGLGSRGQVPDTIQFATSKSVVRVQVNEVTESASNELLRNEDDEARIKFTRPAQTIRYTVDVDFLRVDPGVLALMTGQPVVLDDTGDVVGFDAKTRVLPASFGLEVWSKLEGGGACIVSVGFGEGPFGLTPFGGDEMATAQYGYTLFPFLKGGRISGFSFDGGLVSFNLRGAQTRKASRWGVGPHDLEGVHKRLLKVVSRNSSFQNFITPAAPPVEACGLQETEDVIYGGDAASTTSGVIDGEFVETSPWIIEGGGAA